ncbi:MAG: hypothetical protein RTU63_11015, partial [Candidatus Thorarchaeota archaeon]
MESRILNVATIIALTFLLLIGIFSTPVSAAVVWSDDFSDGNYSGWTILEGGFETPVSPKYSLTGVTSLNMIYHPSTQVHGNWLFELYEDVVAMNWIEIIFIATGTTLEDFEGYYVQLRHNAEACDMILGRWNYSSTFEKSAKWLLVQGIIWTDADPVPDPAWHQYNVTRTATGNITVSRDDEILITSTPSIDEWDFADINNNCDKLVVKTENDGSVDTIVVETDLLPITTETTTTTTTTMTNTTTTSTASTTDTTSDLGQYLPLIAIGGGAIFVIVVIVLI